MTARSVWVLRDGADDGADGPRAYIALCERCMAGLSEPARAWADVIARNDCAHCIECDYHLGCDATCAALRGLVAYQRALARLYAEPVR